MTRDWADSDYIRIYATVLSDPKFTEIYPDDAAFAWYARLLLFADAAYPAPAPLPRGLPDPTLAKLVSVGIIDLVPTDLYTVRGMRTERDYREGHQRLAGLARAKQAERDPITKRFLPGGASRVDPSTSQRIQPSRVRAESEESRASRPVVNDEEDPVDPPPSYIRTPDQLLVYETAFLVHGSRPTQKQMSALDEVGTQRAGYKWLTEQIRLVPVGVDWFRRVLEADREHHRAASARADAQEQESKRFKEEERRWIDSVNRGH